MLSRRELMGKGAVGAAATALALGAATAGAATAKREGRLLAGVPAMPALDRDEAALPAMPAPAEAALPPAAAPVEGAAITAPPPWALVHPLGAGARLAHGWRLAELGPVRDGACVVTLQNARGRARRVHLC